MKHKDDSKLDCVASPEAGASINVQEEVRTIARAGREIARSQKSARAFLQKAGLVTAKGNLSKKYR